MEKLSREERRFIELLTDYCLMAAIPDPESVLEGREFAVAGVDFRLAHLPELDAGLLHVWCDFGHVPVLLQSRCYLELLQVNADRYDGIAPVLARCPDTGMVVACSRLLLVPATAALLDEFLHLLAAEALRWQGVVRAYADQARL